MLKKYTYLHLKSLSFITFISSITGFSKTLKQMDSCRILLLLVTESPCSDWPEKGVYAESTARCRGVLASPGGRVSNEALVSYLFHFCHPRFIYQLHLQADSLLGSRMSSQDSPSDMTKCSKGARAASFQKLSHSLRCLCGPDRVMCRFLNWFQWPRPVRADRTAKAGGRGSTKDSWIAFIRKRWLAAG